MKLLINLVCRDFRHTELILVQHPLRNSYQQGELDRGATVALFATVQKQCSCQINRVKDNVKRL